jgi:hypothetical protein
MHLCLFGFNECQLDLGFLFPGSIVALLALMIFKKSVDEVTKKRLLNYLRLEERVAQRTGNVRNIPFKYFCNVAMFVTEEHNKRSNTMTYSKISFKQVCECSVKNNEQKIKV